MCDQSGMTHRYLLSIINALGLGLGVQTVLSDVKSLDRQKSLQTHNNVHQK